MVSLAWPFAAALLALIAAGVFATRVLHKPAGSPKMLEIAGAIRRGSMAYLSREYRTVAVFGVIIAAALGYFISLPAAVTFIAGLVLSALAGFAGMAVSVRANTRTAAAAGRGLQPALSVAVQGGAVTGLFVAGLALAGVTFFTWLYRDPLLIVGFGFGASLLSLFARIGGGIYTKAADVGADLVGKLEAGIPEDDPRNPAVIADNVGDNVGDCAGMGADLFETYAVGLIAAMLLGFAALGWQGLLLPLLLGAAAIVASIIGIASIRLGKDKSIMKALYKGLIATAIVAILLFSLLVRDTQLLASAIIGVLISLALFAITEYYTSKRYSPVRGIAASGKTGAATVMIAGLSVGLSSTWAPVLVIVAGILASFSLAGLFGIAITVAAMLSLTGIIITLDAYGPITDNAGGIAEMARLPAKVRKATDALDAVGNTTKAVTKSFAIGSAALAALTLLAAYLQEVGAARAAAGLAGGLDLSLTNPLVISGLLIGGLIPFFFSARLMGAVGRSAFAVVEEVRRQFRLGILKGKAKPDYAKAVDIVTRAALKEMAAPALLAVLAPLVVGFLLGPVALAALLLGSIISGLLLALTLTTSGAAWDNAKKLVEASGGKGTDQHKAMVVGDTVGDPAKDSAGPAINPLIKVMNTIAILFVSLFVLYALV